MVIEHCASNYKLMQGRNPKMNIIYCRLGIKCHRNAVLPYSSVGIFINRLILVLYLLIFNHKRHLLLTCVMLKFCAIDKWIHSWMIVELCLTSERESSRIVPENVYAEQLYAWAILLWYWQLVHAMYTLSILFR